MLSPNSAFADRAQEYKVRVTYVDCYENGEPTGYSSRNEEWIGKGGKVVYQEYTGCNGVTSTSGKKPMIGSSDARPVDLSDMGGGQMYYDINRVDTPPGNPAPSVQVEIIDFTGSPVQSLTVSEDAIIDASSLSDGIPYAVVSSTTENGTIDVKTIMKYGSNIFISSTENK